MDAALEILAAVIRVNPRDGTYDYAVAVSGDGDLAVVKGLTAPRFDAAQYRAIAETLAKHGFKRLRYYRGDGRTIERELDGAHGDHD